MSFLSEEMKRQMEVASYSVYDLAAKTSISRGQIYNWFNSAQTSISAEQLTAIATALSDKKEDHAALVAAHLRDEKFGAGSELVRIELDSAAELRDRPRPRTKLERAMEFHHQNSRTERAAADWYIETARYFGCENL